MAKSKAVISGSRTEAAAPKLLPDVSYESNPLLVGVRGKECLPALINYLSELSQVLNHFEKALKITASSSPDAASFSSELMYLPEGGAQKIKESLATNSPNLPYKDMERTIYYCYVLLQILLGTLTPGGKRKAYEFILKKLASGPAPNSNKIVDDLTIFSYYERLILQSVPAKKAKHETAQLLEVSEKRVERAITFVHSLYGPRPRGKKSK